MDNVNELTSDFLLDIGARIAVVAGLVRRLKGPPATETLPDDDLATLMRQFHTVKACADFMQLAPVVAVVHKTESLLQLLRQKQLPFSPEQLNLLEAVCTFILETVEQDAGADAPPPQAAPLLETLAQLQDDLNRQRTRPPPPEATGLVFHEEYLADNPDRLDELLCESPDMARQDVVAWLNHIRQCVPFLQPSGLYLRSSLDDIVDRLRRLADLPLIQPQPAPLKLIQHLQDLAPLIRYRHFALEAHDFGVLADLVIILRNAVADLLRGTPPAIHGVVALHELLDDLAEKMRGRDPPIILPAPDADEYCVPMAQIARRVEHMARQLAAKMGKQIEFVEDLEPIQLRFETAGRFNVILLHLIRNALDHGIEPPAERQAAGKPAMGRIEFSVKASAEEITWVLRDDGRGLDRRRIREKAIQSGWIGPHDELSDRELFAIIFQPGFTTVEQPTLISGRGTGMDVVLDQLTDLGGCLEIETAASRGTCFTFFLPYIRHATA